MPIWGNESSLSSVFRAIGNLTIEQAGLLCLIILLVSLRLNSRLIGLAADDAGVQYTNVIAANVMARLLLLTDVLILPISKFTGECE